MLCVAICSGASTQRKSVPGSQISSYQIRNSTNPNFVLTLWNSRVSLRQALLCDSRWALRSCCLIVVCYHLFELLWRRLSAGRTLAQGWRGPGLECGKCPHPSSQFGALDGAEPLSAAGRHPGRADGGARTALG